MIVANVIHVFSPARNRKLLRRVREAVERGARLLLADRWPDPTHAEPRMAALLAGDFLLVAGEGDVYREEELRGWLGETGWRFLERMPVDGAESLVTADVV